MVGEFGFSHAYNWKPMRTYTTNECGNWLAKRDCFLLRHEKLANLDLKTQSAKWLFEWRHQLLRSYDQIFWEWAFLWVPLCRKECYLISFKGKADWPRFKSILEMQNTLCFILRKHMNSLRSTEFIQCRIHGRPRKISFVLISTGSSSKENTSGNLIQSVWFPKAKFTHISTADSVVKYWSKYDYLLLPVTSDQLNLMIG